MTPSEQIKAWRKKGWKVTVHHHRAVQQQLIDGRWILLRGMLSKLLVKGRDDLRIWPYGGAVELTVVNGDEVKRVVEVCSPDDQFRRLRGLANAVRKMRREIANDESIVTQHKEG